MRHLTESILSKNTEIYKHEEIDADSSFLKTLSELQKLVGRKPEYFRLKPYDNGYQPYSEKSIDLDKLAKEINRTDNPILVDENGAILVTDKNRKSGFYLGFWGNGGKLNQVISINKQFRNEYYIGYDYPGHPEIGVKEFKEWLEENYK